MAKTRMKLATPGKRFGAACIDTVIPFVLYIIIMIAASRRSTISYGYGYGYGYYHQSSSGATAAMVIALVLMLAYAVVECVFFAKSETIGKHLLGLRVVSSLNGKQLGFWKMMYREVIVKQASNVLLLGYIWIIVDDRHRAWHDKILDTYVIDAKASGLVAAPVAQAAPAVPAAPYEPAQTAAVPAAQPAPAPAAEPVPAAAPAVEPAPAPVAPAVEPAPAPEVHTRNTRPAIRLDLEDEPSVAVDVEVEAAPAPAPAAPKRPTIRLDIDEPAPVAVKADMSMKKDELLEAAAKLGVSVSSRATKAEIIEAIEKASK